MKILYKPFGLILGLFAGFVSQSCSTSSGALRRGGAAEADDAAGRVAEGHRRRGGPGRDVPCDPRCGRPFRGQGLRVLHRHLAGREGAGGEPGGRRGAVEAAPSNVNSRTSTRRRVAERLADAGRHEAGAGVEARGAVVADGHRRPQPAHRAPARHSATGAMSAAPVPVPRASGATHIAKRCATAGSSRSTMPDASPTGAASASAAGTARKNTGRARPRAVLGPRLPPLGRVRHCAQGGAECERRVCQRARADVRRTSASSGSMRTGRRPSRRAAEHETAVREGAEGVLERAIVAGEQVSIGRPPGPEARTHRRSIPSPTRSPASSVSARRMGTAACRRACRR